jgi:outer membrane protein
MAQEPDPPLDAEAGRGRAGILETRGVMGGFASMGRIAVGGAPGLLLLTLAVHAAASQATPPARTPAVAAPAQPGPVVPDVTGRLLSLPEVISIAMATQPEIRARLSDYDAARARVFQVLSPMLPQLTGTWSISRARTTASTNVGGIFQDFEGTFTTARLTLSQLLFDFGKNFASTEAASRLADIAREDVEVQRDVITLAVKEAYFNLLFAKRLITVAQQALDRAELNLRSAQGFYEVGTRPKSDVTRAEVDVANARVDLIRASNAERLARVALNTGMGIAVDSPTEVQEVASFEPVVVDQPSLLPEARRGRPEYRQAKLRVEAADAAARREFRNFFPDITGNASVGATTLDYLQIWDLGVALNWNIFDGGNKLARYREATAAVKAAQARVRVTELDIWQAVEAASLNIQETEERIQAAQKAVESARENFRLAQGRFDAGVGTIIELTDAQLALTQAQFTEAQAVNDYRINVARLERALGRR